jgi:hypothetical protein
VVLSSCTVEQATASQPTDTQSLSSSHHTLSFSMDARKKEPSAGTNTQYLMHRNTAGKETVQGDNFHTQQCKKKREMYEGNTLWASKAPSDRWIQTLHHSTLTPTHPLLITGLSQLHHQCQHSRRLLQTLTHDMLVPSQCVYCTCLAVTAATTLHNQAATHLHCWQHLDVTHALATPSLTPQQAGRSPCRHQRLPGAQQGRCLAPREQHLLLLAALSDCALLLLLLV